MTTPSHRPGRVGAAALGFAAIATFLGSACALDPVHDDDEARLAVVFVADSGLTQSVGSYDVASGELTFEARAQDDMSERVGDAGYRALVDDDGELFEVDLEAGVVLVTAELDDGDALELRVVGADIGTLVLGRLELRADVDELAPTWRMGNKLAQDDWLGPII
jgi:hypothetical protein